MTKEDIQNKMVEDKIEYILAQFVDIHGSAKVKMVPVSCFNDLVEEGAGFAGGAVWGLGQGPHSHDMMARADINSYTPLPWKEGVARFACDIYVDNRPYPYCSRVNLKRVLADLRKEGYIFNVGMEPEHFLVRRNGDGSISVWDEQGVDRLDKPCYDFKGISQAMEYLRDINNILIKLGWGVYQSDHEDANGQYEINFRYTDALTTADRYTFFKMLTSQIAKKYGFIATHMAKPFANQTGSGAHFHFHLADAKTGRNLFIDEKDPRGLGQSKLAYNFLGGLIKHARAMCALTSPTVNCYKRLQIGAALYGSRSGYTWTPAFITYGDNNRTQMFRTPSSGRFEDRSISAACNPYLAMAVYIKAGMDGIKNKIDPGEPNIGKNMYEMKIEDIKKKGIDHVPQSLPEALNELAKDGVVQSGLGVIHDEFVKLKETEWKQYHRTVSQWEIEKYLELF